LEAAGRTPARDGAAFTAALALVVFATAGSGFEGSPLLARPVALAAVTMVGAWLLSRIASRQSLRSDGPRALLLAAFVSWAALSALWSSDLIPSSRAVTELLGYGVLYVVLVELVDRRERLERVGLAVALGALVPAAGLLAARLTAKGLAGGVLGFVALPVASPERAAFALAVTLPVGASLVAGARSAPVRWVAGASGALALTAILSSGSERAPLIAAFALLVALFAGSAGVWSGGRTLLAALSLVLGGATFGELALLPGLETFGWERVVVGAGAGVTAAASGGLGLVRGTLGDLGVVGAGLMLAFLGRSVAGALHGARAARSGALCAALVGVLMAGVFVELTGGGLPGVQLWLMAALSSAAGGAVAQGQTASVAAPVAGWSVAHR
jgi:hypothetical protein